MLLLIITSEFGVRRSFSTFAYGIIKTNFIVVNCYQNVYVRGFDRPILNCFRDFFFFFCLFPFYGDGHKAIYISNIVGNYIGKLIESLHRYSHGCYFLILSFLLIFLLFCKLILHVYKSPVALLTYT